MKIIFLNGGYLNEQGPFECGDEVNVSEADALQLIEQGAALPIAPISARPITISIQPQEFKHV